MARVVVTITKPEGLKVGRCTFGAGSTYALAELEARDLITAGDASFSEVPDQDGLDDAARTALEASFTAPPA
jgi:hypothetical protein